MKKFCSPTVLILLVAMNGMVSGYSQDDIRRHLNMLRYFHGAGKLDVDSGLIRKAKEATNAVCRLGTGHHKGTESYSASLRYTSAPCKQGRQSEYDALNRWYGTECPKYKGKYQKGLGHFTHMVWKSSKRQGIYAQTCNIPNTSFKCVVALRTDGDWNTPRRFSKNVGKFGNSWGQCFPMDCDKYSCSVSPAGSAAVAIAFAASPSSFGRQNLDFIPQVPNSPILPYTYGLNPFINNQHLYSSAYPFSYNFGPKLMQNVKTYTEVLKPAEAPVAPEVYVASQDDEIVQSFDDDVLNYEGSETISGIGCHNYKGEKVPCNY